MKKMTLNNFGSFRLVKEFNHVDEFIATGFLLWTLLAMASSLLVMQKELVEYKIEF